MRSVEHSCTLVYAWTLVRFSGIFQPLKCSSATWRWKSFGPRLRSAADTFSPLMYGPCKHDSVDNGVTKGPGSIKQDGWTKQRPCNKAIIQTRSHRVLLYKCREMWQVGVGMTEMTVEACVMSIPLTKAAAISIT